MKKTKLILLTAAMLLLCSCSKATVTWETVDDTVETSAPLRKPAFSITFDVPTDTVRQTFACSQGREVYEQADGDYEIVSEILRSTGIDDAAKKLTGFDSRRLFMIRTTRFGMPEYQFAWYSLGENGGRVCRAAVLDDGQDCYCLSFCTREGCIGDYDSTIEEVFASLGLFRDEGF